MSRDNIAAYAATLKSCNDRIEALETALREEGKVNALGDWHVCIAADLNSHACYSTYCRERRTLLGYPALPKPKNT